MILLFFGQPASGKTTLADAFVKAMDEQNYFNNFIRMDGDQWRKISDNNDYSRDGRIANLKSAFTAAKFLDNEGFTPVLSFISPYEELRQYLSNGTELMMIYLTCSHDRGRNSYFAIDFELPSQNCMRIDTSDNTIDYCVSKVIKYFLNFRKTV